MRARHVVVHGFVQGVGFRWSTLHEARRLGVAGWVRNRDDGSVEVVAEGAEASVDALVAWLHHGPRSASVSRVEVGQAQPQGYAGFEVEP